MVESSVRNIVKKCSKSRSITTHSHKARPLLLQFRAHKLPEILKDLKVNGCVQSSDANAFLWQMLVEKVYLKLLLDMHNPTTEAPLDCRRLQAVELNAIRYAAGFVVRKLLHSKETNPNEFVYCLKKMLTDDSDILVDCDGSIILWRSIQRFGLIR